jgi:hypothetical protein
MNRKVRILVTNIAMRPENDQIKEFEPIDDQPLPAELKEAGEATTLVGAHYCFSRLLFNRPILMPKFAANLTFLFTGLAFLDRFKAARDVGFRAVEFMFPYDYEKGELVKRLHDNDLELILHNLPAGFIDQIGYGNWIGCEYKPSKDTLSSLSWLKRYA